MFMKRSSRRKKFLHRAADYRTARQAVKGFRETSVEDSAGDALDGCPFVFPAKGCPERRRRVVIQTLRVSTPHHSWIPACAGMTDLHFAWRRGISTIPER